MPPSVGDNVILESGTIKTDKVAMKDLAYKYLLKVYQLKKSVSC